MEDALDEALNGVSTLFGSIFTARYHHTCVVLTHTWFWMCTSQGQQLKYQTDAYSLLFYLFSGICFLLSFPLNLLYMHNSLSYILRLSLLLEMTSRVFAEQFSPSDDGAHTTDSGDSNATRKRQSFKNKPWGYQWPYEPGHSRFAQPMLCRSTFWDERERCQNNTQQALPVQQNVTHCLLVGMHVHLMYR